MKRIKKHKVKSEAPETSTSHSRDHEIHDLAYYIHDRVELMHQVFSVIKYKELKAMVPASIRNISLDDLQELCTEELLGISSKRLCAILDGADPPSDTESSSPSPPPELETISLDSISSDDEILSQTSNKKKKHKHRRHSKPKPKRKRSLGGPPEEPAASRASRAGLTVLELLELQARARAIRAQLTQEQLHKPVSETTTKEPPNSSDNEVEIKEEPPEVVEISSDEEKPKLEELQKIIKEKEAVAPQPTSSPATVTKRVSELVITVPQKTKQKIKLNRNKSIPATADKLTSVATKTTDAPSVATLEIIKPTENQNVDSKNSKKDKSKKKKKDKKNVSKDDIDNDEITLQLSDTEKMDLLEDFDRKHYDSVSSESSSESSSGSNVSVKEEDSKDSDLKQDDNMVTTAKDIDCDINTVGETGNKSEADNNQNKEEPKATSELITEDITNTTEPKSSDIDITEESKEVRMEPDTIVHTNKNIEIVEINLETQSDIIKNPDSNTTSIDTVPENSGAAIKDTPAVATKDNEEKETENNLSEGELSDRESSEIEAVDLKPEVVCISDEEGAKKAKKKKKKKEKKSKKDKKSKKKSDFRESADQNFFKDNLEMEICSQGETQDSKEAIYNTAQSDASSPIKKTIHEVPTEIIDKIDLTAETTINNDLKPIKEELLTDNDIKTQKEIPATLSDSDVEAVYEIMELSDHSSCCEVECTTILSKEPTASEIEALSAKIDEIQRVDIITAKEIRDYERRQEKADVDHVEHNISWKDRYLESNKVKKVLTTANIFNALRKKNIELKKKLAESKMETEEAVSEEQGVQEENLLEQGLEEGSIEHYNTLEALTTYVDPVKVVPKDLKKDAKLLLKMYRKLLKYNDMNKPEDPNKKRKKKKKKIKKDMVNTEEGKDTEVVVDNVVSVENEEVSVDIGGELGSKDNALSSKETFVSQEGD